MVSSACSGSRWPTHRAIQAAAGLPADAPLPAADRVRVRTEVAREFFLAEHGREPMDARELAGQSRRLPAADTDGCWLRPDVLPVKSVLTSGDRRSGGRGCDRTGPSGRGEGRFGVH